MRRGRLSIAYVHYGSQSGVTAAIAAALGGRGHELRLVAATGDLEPRDPATRRLRPAPPVVAHLALAAARYGRLALRHRWNTTYAWDRHASRAGERLRALAPAPDLVLQNGALFAPGLPPPLPYALLLDHTRALAQASPPWPAAGLAAPVDYGPGWRAREAAVYGGARVIATFSANVARSLVRDYGVDRGRIAVVGAGANVFPDEAPRRDDGRTLLFVGKDFRRKGGPILLDAFARLRRRRPRARLLVAGPREVPPLPEGAFHLGPVATEELPALLAQATALVLPTLREPFGIAFLDAMACAVPCVGTRVEAVPEIVVEGVTGVLVPPGDAVALAGALERLLDDPQGARAMGARGRARVAERFTWARVAARLERALLRAAGGDAPGPRAPRRARSVPAARAVRPPAPHEAVLTLL
ncbi:glycosyltransferase family 4 protein [Anaeromyxobacter dehalogenans]|uniref:Glycosyl transferase, group 1 n=1 Tax=Anaeromyxobacter dehalogenans (strain 2CP-C) TaxID=290397 RepID=Q2IH00_ANADE|nr:glycosyltransferase family 4 protein [Anaeromyxobacter dehalogenans]ABC83859.1 glycosyl transferase, group 1 [Anaeromyxobacter dehalogenans 2CP-C]